ncbi:MAG: TRAP transporter small permease [SAR202 cluster bacterium]|nr:TRAP transporter small permease [SAR202 cluster bacterium]
MSSTPSFSSSMDYLLIWARRLARYGAWFGGALILGAAGVITVEILIRKFFSMSIGGADELSTFALAIGSAWAFSFTMLDRAHVRIESLYVIFPTRLCALLDVVAQLLFTLIIALVAWYGFKVFAGSWSMNSRTLSPLSTPLAIPQFFWASGLIFFFLVSGLLFFRALIALCMGDLSKVQALIGPRTLQQEVEQES